MTDLDEMSHDNNVEHIEKTVSWCVKAQLTDTDLRDRRRSCTDRGQTPRPGDWRMADTPRPLTGTWTGAPPQRALDHGDRHGDPGSRVDGSLACGPSRDAGSNCSCGILVKNQIKHFKNYN